MAAVAFFDAVLSGETTTVHFRTYLLDRLRQEGCVYFLAASDGHRVKIGWTRNLTRRQRALQTGAHERLCTLSVVPGSMNLEKALHRTLSHLRLRGEWFDNTEGAITTIADAMLSNFFGCAASDLRRQGEDDLAEADRLDQLYREVTEARP